MFVQITIGDSDMGIRKSEEEIDKMCVIFENTGNLREVVRELGSNTVTVSKYLKERGYTVELGTKKYSPKIKDKAMKMYKDGYTAKEISNKLDISIDSVLAEKRKREIPIYPRSEYKIKENASKEEVGLGVIAFFDSDNYNTMD